MSTLVGGRMETVAPIRVTDGSDRVRLIGLLLISLLLHAWLIRNSAMTARDSLGFAQLAVNLTHPSHGQPGPRSLPDVLRSAKQPPGYPATIYAVYFILQKIDPPEVKVDYSAHRLLRAAQIAAAGAMVLAVLPMYWLGRMLLDKNRGFAAVLIFQFLPIAARDTSDGLSEGLYFLGLSSALALGVAGVRKQSVGRCVLCGIASGATYLVRPEGLAVAVGAVFVLLGLAALRWRPRMNMLACAAAVLAGTFVAATPYMVMIGGLTNKPSGKEAIEGTPAGPMRPGLTADAGGGLLFAEISTELDRGGPAQKAAEAGSKIAREYLHASHYAVGVLGIVGLILIRHRLRTHPEWLLMLATAGIHLAALARVAYSQGYASERHLLTAAFVATYFAVAGWEPLFARFARWPVVGNFYRTPAAMWVWTAVLIGICIPSLTKPMHQNRIGFKSAGDFLAGTMDPDDRLTDPYEWTQFYAGKTIYNAPNSEYRDVEYAVLRMGPDADDRRLNQAVVEYAKSVAADPRAQVVYRWPVGKMDEAKIVVYRLDRPAFSAILGGTNQRW